MTDMPLPTGAHEHVFLGADHGRNMRRTGLVVAITAAMMVIEIVAGTILGSMALVADGWHMATHAAALGIAVLAYGFSARQARNPHFTFGTGKVGDLAAFASAVALMLVALLIGWESGIRFLQPVTVGFDQALLVAVAGLVVNLICAFLLRDDHGHHHGHDHGHDHHHAEHHGHAEHGHNHHDNGGADNNLRAAYLHVVADALTSVLAILALLAGSLFGWLWMDPLMGIVGALVIARWSIGMLRQSGGVLVDYVGDRLPNQIRQKIEDGSARVVDLHVWRVGPGHHAAIIALDDTTPKGPEDYKARLASIEGLSHVTVEVSQRG